jgi:predicted O-methyltransferase YrrM
MTLPAFDRVLEIYRQRMAQEEAQMRVLKESKSDMRIHRDQLLLPVGEEVARLMVELAVGLRARTIFELGSSYGYSTLYLADAARRTGGKLVSFEIDAAKQAYAKDHIEQAGLGAHVEWRLGDAVALLEHEKGPVNFVLLDLWKDLYIPCLDRLYPILAPNGLIVADNMLYPEFNRPEATAYRAAVRSKAGMQAVLLPIGQGIDLACRSDRGA